jgi:hypothetical protein
MGSTYPASAKQSAFLARLGYRGDFNLSSRDASALIDLALAAGMDAPARAGAAAVLPVRERVASPGMYRVGERIFKVQRAKESGNLYAKELVAIGGRRLNEAGDAVGFEFQYAPGALALIAPADALTLEEARAFGIAHGVCAVCGAALKDAPSVAAGIGPVCAKRLKAQAAAAAADLAGPAVLAAVA